MPGKIKYITQLTADDIAKMMAAGNLTAGRGIKVDMVGDKLQVTGRIQSRDIVTSDFQDETVIEIAINGVRR